MGACLSFFNNKEPKNKRKLRIAFFGLDNAGKTTTARSLARENLENVAPTIGFCSFQLPPHKDNKLPSTTMYDLGGGKHIRDIWSRYFAEVHGVVFVVDSSDQGRMPEARVELQKLLQHPLVSGKPLLILANKQDVEGSLEKTDVCSQLNLNNLCNTTECPTLLEAVSARQQQMPQEEHKKEMVDERLLKALDWLVEMVVRQWSCLDARVERDTEKMKEEEEKAKKERKERVEMARRIGDANTSSMDNDQNIDNDEDLEISGVKRKLTDPFKPINQISTLDKSKSEKTMDEGERKRHQINSRSIFSRMRSRSEQSDSRHIKGNQVSPIPAQ